MTNIWEQLGENEFWYWGFKGQGMVILLIVIMDYIDSDIIKC